jgi:lysophospholipase L1-like esterase
MKIVVPAALIALLAALVAPAGRSAAGANCSRTSVGFTALPDLKGGSYRGFRGGLYAGGKNAPSAPYLKQGLAAARRIRPIGGKIVLLSVGMSNTTQEYQAFKRLADADPGKNPSVVVVDGAQGGQDAERIRDPSARFWSVIDQRLAAAGATAVQVQAAWLKEAIARPTEAFPADARRLQADLRAIVEIMKARYPNLRIVYLSSRTYGGYASTPLNPEPYAYQSGFAVKWTIQDRSAGRLRGRPWLAWGPYLWTDGTRGRKDGFTWECSDTREDGTHPSESGRRKVAERLLRFFETNRTAKSWFVGR